MAKVTIDGKDYDLQAGQNLLHAVLSEHLNLPYFCWHPAMGSVGSCRLCAIIQFADAEDERGRLQMACMMPVQEGMRVSINAPFAADFRKQVIEWLMENHPHDCPVCEEGGECHLQDMTVMTGHSVRRYRGRKRTWRNQYLGPFIGHEMNRCITCYRCVRYYRDYAGGTDLDVFGSRSRMFFGRAEDGALESEFAGNLVEVCPTGVFTDKPFAQTYTRKWDLQSAPSLCPNCSVGCNSMLGERYGQLKRVHNRYHSQVNGYFLCDRGRYGSHFVNHDKRIRFTGVRAEDGVFEALGQDAALTAAAQQVQRGDCIGIGSPRASTEANFALKELVGEDRFCPGLAADEAAAMTMALAIQRHGGFRTPSLTEVESADAVLILGEDISNTAPRMALAVRQAVSGATLKLAQTAGISAWQDAGVRGHGQGAKNPLFIASAASTRLHELAAATWHGAAHDLRAEAQCIAGAVEDPAANQADDAFAVTVAKALSHAETPLIIAGCQVEDSALLRQAAQIAWALKGRGRDVMLAFTAMEANSYGVAMLDGQMSLEAALERMRQGTVALVLENDLHRRAPAQQVVLDNAIVLDSLETPTAAAAAIVLPAAAYAEQTGTFVNYETRAQRFYQVFEPADEIAPSWRWLAAIARKCGRNDIDWPHIDSLTAACAQGELAALAEAAPQPGFRGPAQARIPRQTHRYSGRTAMKADLSVHEPKAAVDSETPLAYSMEGQNPGDQPGALVPYVWSPGWNSNQSLFKFQQEVGGALTGGDPGVLLIGRRSDEPAHRFSEIGSTQQPKNGGQPPSLADEQEFFAASLHHVFGSEELSAASAPVMERAPEPHVLLHPADAERLGVKAGDGVRVQPLNRSLEVRLDGNIRPRVAGLLQGLPGSAVLASETVRLEADPTFVRQPGSNLIAKG